MNIGVKNMYFLIIHKDDSEENLLFSKSTAVNVYLWTLSTAFYGLADTLSQKIIWKYDQFNKKIFNWIINHISYWFLQQWSQLKDYLSVVVLRAKQFNQFSWK